MWVALYIYLSESRSAREEMELGSFVGNIIEKVFSSCVMVGR